jgi:hypothetical protein
MNQLLVDFFAALEIQNWVHDNHEKNGPVGQKVVGHHSEESRPEIVNVVAAVKGQIISKGASDGQA